MTIAGKSLKQADTLGEIIQGHWEQGNGTDGNRLECLFCLNVYFFLSLMYYTE